ncbi:hypothetical protein CC2G_008997 [Coprinopsis cinerea AmutBmut pab1-1]|nr:hypothetical protein CC2G_008997 [Coprinopsis cinerea AmutBmut pab1-1]
MKLTAVILAVFLSAATANASVINHGGNHVARHAAIARRSAPTSLESSATKVRRRCRPRSSSSAAPPARSSPAQTPEPAPTPAPAPAPAPEQPPPQNNNNNNNFNGGGGGGGNGGGMLWRDTCGGSRPSAHTTSESGVNGHIDWLNCGVHSPGGWQPPYISLGELNMRPLGSALEDPNSPFHACRDFIWIFEQVGGEFGIPPIMLASFAMQESSCRPDTVGGGGEQGLMQITQDKCGGAPGGNCREPFFNIRTGARYFAQTLAANNGDVLISLGQYNGWNRGMTFERATAARYSACCRCQNNLDYLHQFLNGWCQNINAYNNNNRLGKYFNLDVC